ncbi:MAG: imidazolonepropionase [Actinomycetota bacterium]
MTETFADLVITGCSEVVTCDGNLGRIAKGAVAVQGKTIVWVGLESEMRTNVVITPDTLEVQANGCAVIPGFVDAHTHLVFAGERRDEFAARSKGIPYAAGGILKTVADTRSASFDELVELAMRRCDEMIAHGTTTAEAKSGYALEAEGELRLLNVVSEVNRRHRIDLEATFLGAHAVADGCEPEEYVESVINEMIPLCSPYAKWCDVFCDVGAFTPEQSKRILEAGVRAGLVPRIHANELASSGGATVAAEVGAASADHLLFLDRDEAEGLARVGCVGVLAPTTALSLGRFPDVDLMREGGMTLAIASDLNPGMAPVGNLQFAMSIATRTMKMSQEDVLMAVTVGGAAALRRNDIGRIAPGCLADLVILRSESSNDLGYAAGTNLVKQVIKRGRT